MNRTKISFSKTLNDWKQFILADIINDAYKGCNYSKQSLREYGEPIILYGDLYTLYKELIKDVKKKAVPQKDKTVYAYLNDIILPTSGETAIDIARAHCLKVEKVIIGGDIMVLRFKKHICPEFIAYYLTNYKKYEIAKLAQGVSIVHLYLENLKKLKINLPSLPEQRKIASFFSTLDDLVDNLKQQKQKLEEYKKGLMQKLFPKKGQKVPELRFEGFEGEWKEVRLGEVVKESNKRNIGIKITKVLSVNNKLGFVEQTQQFEGRRVARSNLENYKIVLENEFAYNPARINVGSIAILDNYEVGIVSPMYIVFKTRENLLLPYFLHYLLENHFIKWQIKNLATGSVRQSLSFKDFCQIKTRLPEIEEQQRIVQFLSTLDNMIQLKQRQIDKMEEFKKGLMQRMFI